MRMPGADAVKGAVLKAMRDARRSEDWADVEERVAAAIDDLMNGKPNHARELENLEERVSALLIEFWPDCADLKRRKEYTEKIVNILRSPGSESGS